MEWRNAYAIPPNPPANAINGEPIFVQSYINAHNTAFNQETAGFKGNYQKAFYNYDRFTCRDVNSNFIPGTFGSHEEHNSLSQSHPFIIRHLQDDESVYDGISLFICFSRLRRRIGVYVPGLDYSNLWSTLCYKCVLKIYC